MRRIFLSIIFIFIGICPLKAQDSSGDDRSFMTSLDNIKSPFEDGILKPVVQPPAPTVQPVYNNPVPTPTVPAPVVVPPPPENIVLPTLKLNGIVYGEGIQEAIVNDQVVALHGTIEGAEVISMSKDGIEVLYKGKKFFITID